MKIDWTGIQDGLTNVGSQLVAFYDAHPRGCQITGLIAICLIIGFIIGNN